MRAIQTKQRMKRLFGFSLIEMMIVVAIVVIFCAVLAPMFQHSNSDGTVCKGGYKFTGHHSRAVQIIDSQGHGIPCNAQ